MSWKCLGALAVLLAFTSEQVSQAPQVRFDDTLSYGTRGYTWRVFVGETPPVLDRIQCVEYTLDPSFPNPVRRTCKRGEKFAISVTAWDGFRILIKIQWQNGQITAQSYMLELHKSAGPTSVTLNNSFIEKYKNRVTIDATFTVDRVGKIHPASQDGDIHIAGRAPEIGLPTVAEIMNAELEKDHAVKKIQAVEGTGTSIQLSGAWRIWSEIGGQDVEVQGERNFPVMSSAPAHVFEIHPVSKVDGDSIAHTFVPIRGFRYKDAEAAFTAFEGTNFQIIPSGKTTTILTSRLGYNYVEFVMRLNESPRTIEDGTMVFADIETLEGEVIVKHRRMVFVKNTKAETAVHGLRAGDTLHVIGIPRVDLALVSWRISAAADPNLRHKYPQVLRQPLPYEMIVVAVVE